MGRLLLIEHIAVYSTVIVGSAILGWSLLRRPLVAVKARFDRESSSSPGTWPELRDVPIWVAAPGTLLVVVFVGLALVAYFGVSIPIGRLAARLLPQTVGDPATVRAMYVPAAAAPVSAGVRITIGPGDNSVVLTRDDIVLVGESGDLLRVPPQGGALRLTGQDGQRVRVTNVGAWDLQTRSFAGQDAIFQAGRWQLDDSPPRPVNENSDFLTATDGDPIPGYNVTPADAGFTLAHLSDESGPYLRVTATRGVAFLQLNGAEPLASLDGPPVVLRGQIRAHTAAGELNLTLHDVVGDSGHVIEKVTRVAGSEQWTTLVATLPHVLYPSSGDYFALGLVRVAEGDWFDVRELSLYAGSFPTLADSHAP